MAIDRDERLELARRAQAEPSTVDEDDLDRVAMGIYQDDQLREEALDGLVAVSRDAPERATETVAKSLDDALEHEESTCRRSAAIATGNFATATPETFAESVPTLVDVLGEDDGKTLRRLVAEAVESMSREQPGLFVGHVPALVAATGDESLHDDDIERREAVVLALGRVGRADPDSTGAIVDALRDALADPWQDVRRAAVESLIEIGSERPHDVADVCPAVADLVPDDEEDPDVRTAAVEFVEVLGSEDRELVADVLPPIVDLLPEDEPNWVEGFDRAAVTYASGDEQVQARVVDMLGELEND